MSTERERLSLLFDTHEGKLYRLARRLTASAGDAEDLLQETFLRATQSIASIPVGSPKEEAWLTTVLVNVCRDQWRRAAVRRKAAPLLHPGVQVSPPTAESALITRRAVWAALDTLSPRRRAIVVLAELDGVSPQQIATLLGVAVMTVRWHLSLARRELRHTLASHLGDIR